MIHEKFNIKKLLALKKKTGLPVYAYCEDFNTWIEVNEDRIVMFRPTKSFYVDEYDDMLFAQTNYPTVII